MVGQLDILRITSVYPEQLFHFVVEWGGFRVAFAEITGLIQDDSEVEYRDSSTPASPGVVKKIIPGKGKITLKQGRDKITNPFISWMLTVRLRSSDRRDLVIKLLNNGKVPVLVWKASKAYPVKIDRSSVFMPGSSITIASVELAYDGMELQDQN